MNSGTRLCLLCTDSAPSESWTHPQRQLPHQGLSRDWSRSTVHPAHAHLFPLSASLDFVTRSPALHLAPSRSLHPCPGAPTPLPVAYPVSSLLLAKSEIYKFCDPLPWGSRLYECCPLGGTVLQAGQRSEHLLLGGMTKKILGVVSENLPPQPQLLHSLAGRCRVCLCFWSWAPSCQGLWRSPPQPRGCHCPHHRLINRGEVWHPHTRPGERAPSWALFSRGQGCSFRDSKPIRQTSPWAPDRLFPGCS